MRVCLVLMLLAGCATPNFLKPPGPPPHASGYAPAYPPLPPLEPATFEEH
jgi:hypothetical protein